MPRNNLEIIPPRTRREMEHNMGLVFEKALSQLKSGDEMSISSFTHFTLTHLDKLQFLPNGRIYLNSIDESLRLQANTLNNLKYISDPKPIRDEGYEDLNIIRPPR